MPLFKVFLFDFGWLHDTLNSIYIILFYNNNFFFLSCYTSYIQLNRSISGTRNPGVIGDRRSISRESK